MWTPVGSNGPNVGPDRLQELIDEMREYRRNEREFPGARDFDSIRFATYRTASKLRFVQKRTNIHLVGLWDLIEAFRENGLNALPINGNLKLSRLELLLTSIFHNLNKRLPASQHVDTDLCIALLLDIFSQISEPNGRMDYGKFVEYLQQILALPTAVFEGPTFGFTDSTPQQCFRRDEDVDLNRFLDSLMSDSCPPCLMWLPLLHRMAAVENVYHPIVCDACQVRAFNGFRYKCQRCANYQLCQSCFWRGRTSQSHSNEHEMKEYASYKSPTKQIAHSIQKSLHCVPISAPSSHEDFDSHPVRTLDIANIVPLTPDSARHEIHEPILEWTSQLLPGQYGNAQAMDDEHKLIARYAAKLSGRATYTRGNRSNRPVMEEMGGNHQEERAIIAQLEEENNEMLREMAALEQQQALADSTGHVAGLRDHTAELEAKMREKQQIRKHLMKQLENVVSQLNGPGASKAQSHPLNLDTRPELLGRLVTEAFQRRNGDRQTVDGGPMLIGQLQGDLLNAADEITSNMSNLVHELEADDNSSPHNGFDD